MQFDPSRLPGPELLRVLESAVNKAGEAIIILEAEATDGPGRPIIYVNEAFTRMTGYLPDEVIGQTLHLLKGPQTDQQTLDRIANAFETRQPVQAELLNYRKDGSPFWVECNITLVTDDEDRHTHWISIQRDITRRKQAEQALGELREIQAGLADVVFTLDRAGRLTFLNESAEHFFGAPRAELLGRNLWGLPGRPDDLFPYDPFRRAAQQQQVETYEAFSARFNRWFEIYISPLEHGILARCDDITRRKETEQVLRESEVRLRAVFEQAALGMVLVDLDGNLLQVNEAYCQITGYTRRELVDQNVLSFVQPDMFDVLAQPGEKMLAGEMESNVLEHPIVRKDGQMAWVRATTSLVRGTRRQPLYFVAVVEDINERRQAEARLRESEERLQTVIESAPIVLFRTDREGIFTFSRGKGLEALGLQPGEMVGRSVLDVYGGHPQVVASFKKVLAGESIHVMIHIHDRDLEIVGNPLFGPDGTTTGLIGVAVDVTDRVHAQAALVESERSYRGLFDSVIEAILVLGPDGRVLDANPAAAAMFACSDEALREVDVTALVAPEEQDQEVIHACIQETLDGEKYRFDWHGRRCGGAIFPMEVTLNRGRYFGQDVVIATARDVTDRLAYEQELIEAKEEAEAMSRLKTAFLTNMSHELRTPLTSIIGFAELLAEETPEEAPLFAELIRKNGARLLETLTSVLDLAQLESGTASTELTEVNLAEHVRDTLELFRRTAEQKGLRLQFEAPEAPIRVRTDVAALHRILSNLISNALKFTHEGRVTVSVAEQEQQAAIRVDDTGIGIGPDFLDHLFEEFTQESQGLTREYEGNGLGLAISQRLAELVGGEITAESEQGVGSTFTVHLPKAG